MEDGRPLLHRIGEIAASVGSEAPRRRAVKMAIQGGIAVVILAFLVITVIDQWGEIVEKGIHFEALWLIPALVLMPLYFALNAVGWELILRMLGSPIGFWRAQVAWGQPLLARYVPGSVLYLLARLLLAERAGVPRRVTLAGIIYEQALSVAAAVAVSTWFFISHPDLQGASWRWAVLLVVPMALLVLHPYVFRRLTDRLFALFGRESLPVTVPFAGVVAMFCFFAFNWAVMGAAVYFVARSVTFVAFDQIAVVGSAQAIGYVAAVATLVAPAGLGVRDAAFAWTVKAALPSRSFALGSLIALAVRGVVTVAELLYVALVTILARRIGYGWGTGTLDARDAGPTDWSEGDAIDQLEGGEGQGQPDQSAVPRESDGR